MNVTTRINIIIALIGFLTILSISIPTYQHFHGDSKTSFNYQLTQDPRQTASGVVQKNISYQFTNPDLAYNILTQIDKVNTSQDHYKWKLIDQPFFGIIRDNRYCEDHRAFFVHYPEVLFNNINFISSYPLTSLVRNKFLASIGKDVHTPSGDHMPKAMVNEPQFNMKPYVNAYFTKNPLTAKLRIGKNFACTTQVYNRIPGHTSLDQKDNVAENAIIYAQQFKDRPFCFNHDKFFPETWLLDDQKDCKEFFEHLNSEKYQKLKAERTIVYIRKVAAFSHRGEGVFPVSGEEEDKLKKDYGNGQLCGTAKKGGIVQYYIYNPLLINGRKFDFRMYMLIASTNPLIAYYHDGFLRVALASYDAHSTEKKVLLTNLALNKQIYDEVKGGDLYEGMDEEALKVAQQWSFERLHNYLMEAGIVKDPNWLDNYLRPELKKAMVHLLRLSYKSFMEHSSLYELYGVDFMLDENLNVWFIEANSSPALYGYSIPMEKFIVKMLKDHMEVVTGLLRSRMKRIVLFVNKIIKDGNYKVNINSAVKLPYVNSQRIAFELISKNKMEKEFMPSSDNGFSLILDSNLNGAERYQGLILEECL